MAGARAALSVHHLTTHTLPVTCARPTTALAPQHSRVRLASAIHAPVVRLASRRDALHPRRSTPASTRPSSRGVLRVTVRSLIRSVWWDRDTPQGWILRALQCGGWCLDAPLPLCHATATPVTPAPHPKWRLGGSCCAGRWLRRVLLIGCMDVVHWCSAHPCTPSACVQTLILN